MAAQTFAELRDRLDTTLSDSTDRTFSSSEKDEFMTRAFNDPYVYKIVRDTSLTTISQQPSYTVPSAVDEVTDVQVDVLGDGFPSSLDRSTYQVVDGTLYLDAIQKYIPANKTIVLIGKQKLTTSDSIPDFLQEYVLTLAEIEAYSFMKNKYATRFLKNDVSMAELVNSLVERRQHVGELRKNLDNRREIVG